MNGRVARNGHQRIAYRLEVGAVDAHVAESFDQPVDRIARQRIERIGRRQPQRVERQRIRRQRIPAQAVRRQRVRSLRMPVERIEFRAVDRFGQSQLGTPPRRLFGPFGRQSGIAQRILRTLCVEFRARLGQTARCDRIEFGLPFGIALRFQFGLLACGRLAQQLFALLLGHYHRILLQRIPKERVDMQRIRRQRIPAQAVRPSRRQRIGALRSVPFRVAPPLGQRSPAGRDDRRLGPHTQHRIPGGGRQRIDTQ